MSSDFKKFWIGQTISNLGSSFTQWAVPLLVYQLTHSALSLGVATAFDLHSLPPVRAADRRLDGPRRPQEGDDRARLGERHRDPLDSARRAVRAPDGLVDLRRHVHPVDDLHRFQRGRVRSDPEPRFHRRSRDRQWSDPGDLLGSAGCGAAPRRRAPLGHAVDVGDVVRLRVVRRLRLVTCARSRELQRTDRRAEGADEDPARRP